MFASQNALLGFYLDTSLFTSSKTSSLLTRLLQAIDNEEGKEHKSHFAVFRNQTRNLFHQSGVLYALHHSTLPNSALVRSSDLNVRK